MIVVGKHRSARRKIGSIDSLSAANPTWTCKTPVSALCVYVDCYIFGDKPGYVCNSVLEEDTASIFRIVS